jgi:hypothetical protein
MRRRRMVLLTAAVALMPLLVGCAGTDDGGDGVAAAEGGSPDATASPGEAPASDPADRQLQFTRCMRDQGIDVPDPDPNGGFGGRGSLGDVDPEQFRKALEACRQYAGGADGQAGPSEADKQKMLDYIRCLRGEGVDIADPDPETGRPQAGDLQKFLRPDAEMKAAQRACEEHRPEGLGGQSS